MSKKFFSLIHGGDVRLAPNSKIIPAAEISTILSAQEVLLQVKVDAEKYKISVVAEAEKLKEQAQKEGYEAGFKEWVAHIAKLEAEISKVHSDLERMVMPVALKAAKKIVGREVELSETVISDIVANNLKAVAQHKKITIYVNKKDLSTLEMSRPKLKQIFESLEALSIRERADILPGGCIIETEGGIINAQLESRWRVLEAAFENLIKSKGL